MNRKQLKTTIKIMSYSVKHPRSKLELKNPGIISTAPWAISIYIVLMGIVLLTVGCILHEVAMQEPGKFLIYTPAGYLFGKSNSLNKGGK